MTQTETQTPETQSPVGLDVTDARAQLESFGAAYRYDVGYMKTMLDGSPGAFQAFVAGQAMSTYRKALPLDAHYVARVATMQGEDCGPCTQLNLRRAVEEGVDREMLRTLLEEPAALPEPLRDVADHCRAVVEGGLDDPERAARLRWNYGDEGFAELAVCIAGSRIYPTAKRALLQAGVCERSTVDF